jgi:5-formyltetrahydrofolate cyclo-ligase
MTDLAHEHPDDKHTLRARMKAELRAATPAFRATASAAICKSLLMFIDERLPARLAVMVYAPMPSAGEVDISPAIEHLLSTGRTVCLPELDWSMRTMRPVHIHDWAADLIPDLINARLGLRAPREGLKPVPVSQLGLIIIPGLAFDHSGNRLGRGGGFYDRFLASLPSAPHQPTPIRLAVAFHHQLLPAIPTDAHDHPIDALITEREQILFSPRLGGTQSS